MAANFPGLYSNALPGVTYATVILDPKEVKTHHDFDSYDQRTITGDLIFICTKCGLKARYGRHDRSKEDTNKLYILYPHPIKGREVTGEESCAEIIIWDIIE